jgi:TRAP-type C4-dicarboxylate transport system substrate-binding protein
MVTINLDTWKRIPVAHQQAIEKLAAELEPQFWEVSRQGDLDSIKVMTGHGMELVDISPALRAEMASRGKALQEEFLQRVAAARPIVEQFRAARGY